MKKYCFFLIACFACYTSKAQKRDSIIKDQTIEVIQSYKPEIKQVSKPVFTPNLPPKDTAKPRFQYQLSEEVIPYSYTAPALRPLALGADTVKLSFPNYVKLGGGNLSTINFDAGIGQFQGEDYQTAIQLHHLQQQSNLKYQKTSFSGLTASGALQTSSLNYTGDLKIKRNAYSLYGGFVDTGVAAPNYVYTGVNVAATATNARDNKALIDYTARVAADYFARQGMAEYAFNGSVLLSKKLGQGFTTSFTTELYLAYLDYSIGGTASNNMVLFHPKIQYQYKDLIAHAGIKPVIGRGNSSYFLPDLYISYKFPAAAVAFFGGWDGSLRQNTFQQLAEYNPYLQAGYLINQTQQEELYGGLKVGIANNFTFTGKVGHLNYHQLPMFLNNWVGENNFFITYDQVKAMAITAMVRYDLAALFSINVGGTYTNYYQSTYAHVWHEPSFKLHADFSFRPLKDLQITAYNRMMDGMFALNSFNQIEKLPTIFDLGLGGEYQFVSRLSTFINLNNLLNQKYQRWYNYNAYGFNIYGGLRLKF